MVLTLLVWVQMLAVAEGSTARLFDILPFLAECDAACMRVCTVAFFLTGNLQSFRSLAGGMGRETIVSQHPTRAQTNQQGLQVNINDAGHYAIYLWPPMYTYTRTRDV